jgi:uncharacterized iron-regulated membrane protein
MRLRQFFFWLHLAAGVLAGLAIAIMAFTGTLLAFQKEIIAALERDARIVQPAGERLSLDELWQRVRANEATARATAITLEAAPNQVASVTVNRGEVYLLNPYTGAIVAAPRGPRAFFRGVESWHRTLGLAGEARVWGKSVNDAANLLFLFLALSGLYLWWPRGTFRAGWRAAGWFRKLKGRARDWNWHNVFGFWSAPFLIVLTVTALPLSYDWASRAIYTLTGTIAPSGGPSLPDAGITMPSDETGVPRSREQLLVRVEKTFPNWAEITYRGASGNSGKRTESQHKREPGQSRKLTPVMFTVRTTKPWPRMATTTLVLDPISAEILKREDFSDQNAGRQLRSWMRFLHTGEALGWPGQLAAGAFSLFSVVLVYTGWALAWRRFFLRENGVVQSAS